MPARRTSAIDGPTRLGMPSMPIDADPDAPASRLVYLLDQAASSVNQVVTIMVVAADVVNGCQWIRSGIPAHPWTRSPPTPTSATIERSCSARG